MGRASARKRKRKPHEARRSDSQRRKTPKVWVPVGYRDVLAVMGFGMTIALSVVVFGLILLSQQVVLGTGVDEPDHDHEEALVDRQAQSSPVNIEIDAKHLGSLEVQIEALVTMNEPKRGLTQAQVVAYTDMVEMPRAHPKGPLSMEPVPGQPGRYTVRSRQVMLGTYKVRVVVRQPVQGEASVVVPVGVVGQAPSLSTPEGNDTPSATEAPAASGRGQTVDIAMVPTNRFDKTEIVVRAGQPVTINVYNEDQGVMHNFAVYDPSAGGTLAFMHPCQDCQESIAFEAPLPGEYLFRCDLHPSQMRGRFVVLPEEGR